EASALGDSEAATDGEGAVGVALGCLHEANANAMDTGNNKLPAKRLSIFDIFGIRFISLIILP
ncbi:MAG: hypothetical protein ACOYMQ_03270, partial [Pseudanabaena sp.]